MRILLALMAMTLFAISTGCDKPADKPADKPTTPPTATETSLPETTSTPSTEEVQTVSLKLPGMT